MFVRITSLAVAMSITAVALAARADESQTPPVVRVTHDNPLAGTVLTSVGGSMVLGAPVVVMFGAAIASASGPYSYAALGPVVVGAFGTACIGLGMLIPGIVMLATYKRAPHHDATAIPLAPKEPTWINLRPAGTPRAVTIPIFRTSF
jgi:hypothetical protein